MSAVYKILTTSDLLGIVVDQHTDCATAFVKNWRIKGIYNRGSELIFTQQSIKAACVRGSIDALIAVFKYYHESEKIKLAARYAARGGHKHILEWLWSNYRDFPECDAIDYAAGFGDLNIVKWLHSEKMPLTVRAVKKAAKNGHLHIIKWLNTHTYLSQILSTHAVAAAAVTNQLHVVDWVYDNCGGFTTDALAAAATNGHLEMLKLLYSRAAYSYNEALWVDMLQVAAANGHLHMIKWVHDNNIVLNGWGKLVMNQAAAKGYLHIVEWLHQNRTEGCTAAAMDHAAGNGHLHILVWLHQNRSEGCTYRAIVFAAEKGHLEICKWIDEKYPSKTSGFNSTLVNLAARNGHMCIIKWLHTHKGGGFTNVSAANAAAGNHNIIVHWLRENYPEDWDPELVVRWAASGGNLEIIKWIYANHPDQRRWIFADPTIMKAAVINQHIHLIKWLHYNVDMGYTEKILSIARNQKNPNIAGWIAKNCRKVGELAPETSTWERLIPCD